MSRRSRTILPVTNQTMLWPQGSIEATFNVINRRRSLIRRLDHLLEDAANEQFHEAAVVLRDALERLRMALVKDTLALQHETKGD